MSGIVMQNAAMCPAFLAPAVTASPSRGIITAGQHHPAMILGMEMARVKRLISKDLLSGAASSAALMAPVSQSDGGAEVRRESGD